MEYRYEISYPLAFDVESDRPLTREELVEEFTELIFSWVEHGVKPNPEALRVTLYTRGE